MKFFVTFGQNHPLRDNWIEVEASDEISARRAVNSVIGNSWAYFYEETKFDSKFFPGGKVGYTLFGG